MVRTPSHVLLIHRVLSDINLRINCLIPLAESGATNAQLKTTILAIAIDAGRLFGEEGMAWALDESERIASV